MDTNKITNQQLLTHFQIVRTGTSLSNTFLALLRTVVVLIGVSALLIKQHKAYNFNTIFISLLLFLVILSSWQFYNNSQDLIKYDAAARDNNEVDNQLPHPRWNWLTPLYFAGLLTVMLIVLLFIHIKFKD